MAAFKALTFLALLLAPTVLAKTTVNTFSSTTFNGTGNGVVTIHVTMTDNDPTTTVFGGGGNGGSGPHNVADGHPADVTVTEIDAPFTGEIPAGLHPTGSHHIDGIVTITAPAPKIAPTVNAGAVTTSMPHVTHTSDHVHPHSVDSIVSSVAPQVPTSSLVNDPITITKTVSDTAIRPDITKTVSVSVSDPKVKADPAPDSPAISALGFDPTNENALHSYIEGLISSQSAIATGRHSHAGMQSTHSGSTHHVSSVPANLASSLNSKMEHATEGYHTTSYHSHVRPSYPHHSYMHSKPAASSVPSSKPSSKPAGPYSQKPSYYPGVPVMTKSPIAPVPYYSMQPSASTYKSKPSTYGIVNPKPSGYEPSQPSQPTKAKPASYYSVPVVHPSPPVYSTLSTHVATRKPSYPAPKPSSYPSPVPSAAPSAYLQPAPQSAMPSVYPVPAPNAAPSVYPKPVPGPSAKPSAYPVPAPPLVSQIPDGQVQAPTGVAPSAKAASAPQQLADVPSPASKSPAGAQPPQAPVVQQSVAAQMRHQVMSGWAIILAGFLML